MARSISVWSKMHRLRGLAGIIGTSIAAVVLMGGLASGAMDNASLNGPASATNNTAVYVPAAPAPAVRISHPRHVTEVRAPATAGRPALATMSYRVRPGDTLSKIAAEKYGSAKDWPVIYWYNKNAIKYADLIYVGQDLKIPAVSGHIPAPPQSMAPGAPVTTVVVSVTSQHGEAPKPRPQPVSEQGGTLSCSGLEGLWESAGGSPSTAFMAAEIAEAESSGEQFATHHDSNGSTDLGYWQINTVNGAFATYSAFGNARAAVELSGDGSNWNPWVTFQTGAYIGKCLHS